MLRIALQAGPQGFLAKKGKLTDADGEQNETRHWLYTAHLPGYLDKTTHEKYTEQCSIIGAQLGLMMKNAADWRPS